MSTQRKHWKVDGPSHIKRAFIKDLKSLGLKPFGNATDDEIIYNGMCIRSHYFKNTYKVSSDHNPNEREFILPQDYTKALDYIKGNIAEADKSEQENKKKFKNSDWSVEGSYDLIKTFKEKLEEVGYIYSDSDFDSEYRQGYKFLTPSTVSDEEPSGEILLFHREKKNHFRLLDQWDEALKYATETEDDQEEIKEGDWVWVVKMGFSGLYHALVKFTRQHERTYGFSFSEDWTESFNIRNAIEYNLKMFKASKSEVEDRLWREWERRCKEAGIEDPMNAKLEHFPNDLVTRVINGYQAHYEYTHDKSKMYNNNGLIFKEGHWAEPKPSLPEIEISGYKAEYKENAVKFGCISVEADTIKELDRVQRESGKCISVLVGDGISNGLTSDDIRQIAEHYSRK